MKPPKQARPIRRPVEFPLLLIQENGLVDELHYSDTTDQNDPGYFPQTDYENRCHIFSQAAMVRCLGGSRF